MSYMRAKRVVEIVVSGQIDKYMNYSIQYSFKTQIEQDTNTQNTSVQISILDTLINIKSNK